MKPTLLNLPDREVLAVQMEYALRMEAVERGHARTLIARRQGRTMSHNGLSDEKADIVGAAGEVAVEHLLRAAGVSFHVSDPVTESRRHEHDIILHGGVSVGVKTGMGAPGQILRFGSLLYPAKDDPQAGRAVGYPDWVIQACTAEHFLYLIGVATRQSIRAGWVGLVNGKPAHHIKSNLYETFISWVSRAAPEWRWPGDSLIR